MSSRFAVMIVLLGGSLFYAFLLYEIAQLPLLGMQFTHYGFALSTLIVVPLVVLGMSWLFYFFYDHIAFLQAPIMRFLCGFLLSFIALWSWDYLVDGVHFHSVTTLIWGLFLMFFFIDDPNSMRSVKRVIKNQSIKT